ncbi:unnamed protein product [Closterium sp. Yama58-4]|nr:unnamed protein product [Closterium sp. Yama58-4]
MLPYSQTSTLAACHFGKPEGQEEGMAKLAEATLSKLGRGMAKRFGRCGWFGEHLFSSDLIDQQVACGATTAAGTLLYSDQDLPQRNGRIGRHRSASRHVLHFGASPGAPAPDPCAVLAAEVKRTGVEKLGLGFAAPSLFRACYSTFLFRKECDVQDLLSIANAFDNHYVYKHIALDSPDQTNLPSSIDIVAELRKVVANGEKGKYARLVDAHMAARQATLALNDGHTMFDPGCFAGSFDLPLPLVAVVENGQQIIRVAPRRYVPKGLDSVAKALHGFDFTLYEGRQVVAINGDKAEDFIRHWADKEVGFTRNLAARFTRSFARNVAAASPNGPMIHQVPGDFAKRTVAPDNDTLLVSFLTPDGGTTEDVQVPWIGIAKLADFANAMGYWKTHCAVPSPSAAAAAGTGIPSGGQHGCGVAARVHSPPRAEDIQRIADHHRRARQGNGGGYVQAAYKAIRLLMGAAKVPDSQIALPMDFVIGTQYTENVIGVLAVDNTTAPHYYLGVYSDLNGTELASAFDYAPFRQLRFTAAGRAGTYSALFKFDHRGQLPVKEEQPVLGERPFLVLSDGDCFSACAVLTHVLGKRHKVPMVTVGGLPNQPPDVSSSCLGFTLTDFYAVAHGLDKLAAMQPQQASLPLKVQGAVRMAFTNAYVDSEIPCEFEFLPSQHHVNYTVDLIDKPWAMWNEASQQLSSPPPMLQELLLAASIGSAFSRPSKGLAAIPSVPHAMVPGAAEGVASRAKQRGMGQAERKEGSYTLHYIALLTSPALPIASPTSSIRPLHPLSMMHSRVWQKGQQKEARRCRRNSPPLPFNLGYGGMGYGGMGYGGMGYGGMGYGGMGYGGMGYGGMGYGGMGYGGMGYGGTGYAGHGVWWHGVWWHGVWWQGVWWHGVWWHGVCWAWGVLGMGCAGHGVCWAWGVLGMGCAGHGLLGMVC